MSRLDEQSEVSVASLLACARACFGADGYDGVSLSAVAAEAGLTKGAVYHHFGSKPALFESVFREQQRALVRQVVASAAGAPDAAEGLMRGVRTYFEAVLDPGLRRILIVDGPAVLGWESWHRCEEPGFRSVLTSAIGALQREGRLRPGVDPADTAELLLGGLTGCALALTTSDDPSEQAQRFGRAFEIQLEGLIGGETHAQRDGGSGVHPG